MRFISRQTLIKCVFILLACYFTKTAVYAQSQNGSKSEIRDPRMNQAIKTIELRNYFVRPGTRNEFIKYFEENFIVSQYKLGGYVLGQFTIKDQDDHFFWIRGFKDMQVRNKFLNDFYMSPYWKAHKNVPNSLLLNNDNVYLLKPLNLELDSRDNNYSFNTNWFGKSKGIAVVDFYISNTKLDKLIEFVKKTYMSVLVESGVDHTSFWISETIPNEFTALPVFQDKNLMVQITFYKNESEYLATMKKTDSRMTESQKINLADLVTIKNTITIYPTAKSFLAR